MSKNVTKNTEQNAEKVMTKYDLKMQKRQQEKEQAKKQQLKNNIISIALVVCLAAVVASFPIRNYFTVNGAYIEVNGEEISRVEYDYNYNIAKTNYLSTYGTYLYYMGMDITVDFDDEYYSTLRTWGDYFDEITVENIKQNKALMAEAKAAGFTYDVSKEYAEYEEALALMAKEEGMSVKAFIQELYGPYATVSRVKPFIEEGMIASAYYNSLYDQNLPTQEEVLAHYNENKADYDSVDYYVAVVDAVLPTEPTDGSAVSTTGDAATATDGTTATSTYEPTEEEVATAMAEAKAEADKKVKTIKVDGEYVTDIRKADAIYILTDWLFSDERKAGDTTVIEDSLNSRYYAVEFSQRYLSENLSADIRVVMTADGNADSIYNEWKSGAATEESFAAICDKYNDPTMTTADGGLYVGLKSGSLSTELKDWIFSSDRVPGETTVIATEGSDYAYVLYYVAPNKAEYLLEIEDELASNRTYAYLDSLVEKVVVEDPKGNLKYPALIEAETLLSVTTDTTGSTAQ